MSPTRSLQDLPSKGVLPLTGPYGVCTDLPTYIPLHSTSPEQEFIMDDTNPLVRKLQWQKAQQKVTKTPAKGSASSRKRKCAASDGISPADKAERRSSPSAAAKGSPEAGLAARGAGSVDHTRKTYTAIQLSRKHKKGLQEILKAYGATISGIKQDLAERILQAQSRRKDHVVVINDDDESATPQRRSAAAEREGDMAVADDDAEDADADQQMVEADQSSESEAEEDGFERESI